MMGPGYAPSKTGFFFYRVNIIFLELNGMKSCLVFSNPKKSGMSASIISDSNRAGTPNNRNQSFIRKIFKQLDLINMQKKIWNLATQK